MTPALWIAIINFATKFGLDAAAAILTNMRKPDATIDEAIAALREIQQKSADQYLAEARARLGIPDPANVIPAAPQPPAP